MSRNNEMIHPCVKVKSFDERQSNNLKELAKKLAQRKYSTDDNPAIKRLQQRFRSI